MSRLAARLLYAAVIVAVAACAAPRDAALNDAITGQTADVVSTGVALAVSDAAAEANPLGVVLLPLKAGAVVYFNGQPEPGRTQGLNALASFGWGAMANNLCAAAGGQPVVCLPLGVSVLVWRLFNPAPGAAQPTQEAAP